MAENVYTGLATVSQSEDVLLDVAVAQANVVTGNQPTVDVFMGYAVVSGLDSTFLGDVLVYGAYASVACRCDGVDLDGNPLYLSNQWNETMIFTDLIFPPCLSYGSSMVPRYSTNKVEVLSGSEQRNSRREYPRFSYNVSLENFDADELAQVIRIFHVCSGDLSAFLFSDPSDATSKDGVNWIAETETGPLDQTQGLVVGGATTKYQLFKTYKSGARQKRRRIRHPDVSTLRIAIDGFEVTNFNWDTGTQTFQFYVQTSPYNRTVDLSGNTISGGDFTGLNAGDLVTISGFSNTGNNAADVDPVRVVSADGSFLVLENYDGTPYGVANETGVDIVVTQVAPRNGAVITAGYYFYVPVRFDGDQVNFTPRAGLRETFQGELSVTLVEVFE